MRVMMKGEAFSPLYWRAVHYALLDMVRQVGYPRIFLTLAPYEWSFPIPRMASRRDEQNAEGAPLLARRGDPPHRARTRPGG